MSVSNFNFDAATFSATWQNNGNNIFITDVQQACLDKGHDFIVALPKSDPKNSLNIFNELGRLYFMLAPPPGYLFEYLLSDTMHGVRVICSGENERGDILDWYFKIDPSSMGLMKQGRAY